LSCFVIHSRTCSQTYRLKVGAGFFSDADVFSCEPNNCRRAGSRHLMSDQRPTILDRDPASEFARKELLEDKCLSLECALPAADQLVVRNGRGRWACVERISELRGNNAGTGGRRSNRLSRTCEIRDCFRGGADVSRGRRVLRGTAGNKNQKCNQAKRAM